MSHRLPSILGFTLAALGVWPCVAGSVPTVTDACEAISVEACTVQQLTLMPGELGTWTLDLTINGHARTIELVPHDVRGPNYALLVHEEDGSIVEYPPGPITTFRGTDPRHPGTLVAMGMQEDGFRLHLIEHNGDQWYAEPLLHRARGARSDDYAVYLGDAIISPLNECPVDDGWRINPRLTPANTVTGGTRGLI